jgi:hypothetical protein
MFVHEGQIISARVSGCPTERNLRYRPFSEGELSAPPIPLHMHPFRFLAAQIPGIRPTEQSLINWIDPANPRAGLFILDILSYERLFLTSMEVLRTQFVPRAKENFPVLDNEFVISLTFLCMVHRKWLNEFEEILTSGDRTRISDAIMAFGQVSEIARGEKDFTRQTVALASVLSDASLRYSPVFAPKLADETIMQVVSAPRRWWRYMGIIASGLLSVLERNDKVSKAAKGVLTTWAKSHA